MLSPEFESSFHELLQAYDRHRGLRRRHAELPELAASSHDLYRARMRTYRSLHPAPGQGRGQGGSTQR
jgi:hypothetical protein